MKSGIRRIKGEKISAKEIESCELDGKCLSLNETLSHEHVLANELEIGNDDSDGSEEGLETFGELGTTEVTWIHGDEEAHGTLKTNFLFCEHKHVLVRVDLLLFLSIKDILNLRRNH